MGLVLGIDPGQTTGIAILNRKGKSKQFTIFRSGVMLWHNRCNIQSMLEKLKPYLEAIAIEEFRLRANPKTLKAQIGSDIPSVRIIGIVEMACFNLGLTNRVTFQTPAQRLNMDVSKEIKAQLHHSQHGIDSFQHAKYFIFTHWEK